MESSKEISLRELVRYATRWSGEKKRFIIDSDNCVNPIKGTVDYKFVFTDMCVSLHPENIYLTSDNGGLIMYNNIHKIMLIDDPDLPWSICELACLLDKSANCKHIISKILID